MKPLRLIACLLLCAAAPVCAQAYPAKTVRIVVGFAPGGSTDVTARIMAQELTKLWNQQVVVDNRPGASGMIGAELAAKRPRTAEQVPRALARGCDPGAGCSAGLKSAVVTRAFTVASP